MHSAVATHSTFSSYLDELNPAQRAAVTFGVQEDPDSARLSPPLLVIAGAGTGKTKTLAHRVAHLILNGADPRRILLLTFARRMAAEMSRRVEAICASALAGRRHASATVAWSGTFHAVGARLLRTYAQRIGIDPAFSILDRSDAADLMDLVRDELGLAQERRRFPKKAVCLAIYSHAVNSRLPLGEALARTFPWCAEWEAPLKELFAAYVAAKQRQSVLDYDDLLLYWAQMMRAEALARSVSARFDHVLVDEYQDTNALQADILLALKPDGAGLTVVGDDAQSIYSFRSARFENMLEFPGRFDPPAQVVTLEHNYRSTQPILDSCNRIIGHAAERFRKNLYSSRGDGASPLIAMVADEAAQVEYVIERVLANREAGMELRDQAVLFRASHHSGPLELELTRRGIPFVKFGGLKFLEVAHVKDVLSLLRWAENPRDRVAGFRILKLLPGVGPATARRALDAVERAGYALAALADVRPPAAASEQWSGLAGLLRELAAAQAWDGQIARLRLWYDPVLESVYEAARVRRGDIDQLERMALQHQSRASFLTDLTLDPPDASGDEAGPPLKDDDWLTLSTIHSAKGQEWRAVTILNVVDGCIPSDLAAGASAEIEEERRLFYVAMTRARDDLVLMQPLRYYVRGQTPGADRHVYAPRSRFIADADLDAFELAGLGARADVTTDTENGPATGRVDLMAAMRQMWK